MPRRRAQRPLRGWKSVEERRAAWGELIALIATTAERSECDVKDDGCGTGSVRFTTHIDPMARHSRLFEATGNPMHAWQVYAVARRENPHFGLVVLDRFVDGLGKRVEVAAGSIGLEGG